MSQRVFGLVRDQLSPPCSAPMLDDRCVLGRLPDPQLHAPAVRGGFVLDRLRAGVHRGQGNPPPCRTARTVSRASPAPWPACCCWSPRWACLRAAAGRCVLQRASTPSPAKHGLIVDLLRLTFPFLLFVSLTALAAGALNSFQRFAMPALTPVILNLCMIAGALVAGPRLTGAADHGAGLGDARRRHAAAAVPAAVAGGLDLLTLPRWGWRHAGVRKVMRLMVPTLFGSSVAQINLLFDTVIAALLVAGLADLAVAGGSFPGIAAGRVRRRAGHGDPADAVAASRQYRPRRRSPRAGLGPAHDADDRRAGDARA